MEASQKIELRLTQDNRVLARSQKHEQEVVMHESLKGLCAPAQQSIDGARIFVLADPLWWLDSGGKWIEVGYSRDIS